MGHMKDRIEFRYSGWDRRIPRREVLVEGAFIGASALAVIAGIGYAYATKEGESQNLYGKPTSDEIKDLVVDYLPNDQPLLRKELSLDDGDILGILTPGSKVRVNEVLGPIYATGQADLIVEGEDGEQYGLWYKLIEPVTAKTKDGQVVKRSGFIAGNFLKPEEETSADQ